MISDIHVLFSNNKSKVQSHTHNFFLSLARFPWPKLVHEVDFGEGQFFDEHYYLVFKSQDLFLIYKNDLTRRNDFFSVLFISCEFDSIFKKLKFEK